MIEIDFKNYHYCTDYPQEAVVINPDHGHLDYKPPKINYAL